MKGVDQAPAWTRPVAQQPCEPVHWQQRGNASSPGNDLTASTPMPSSHVTSACWNTQGCQLENINNVSTSVCPAESCCASVRKSLEPGGSGRECSGRSSRPLNLHATRSDSTRIKILLSIRAPPPFFFSLLFRVAICVDT